MDRFTYQKLRESRPDLALPPWHRLRRTDRHRAKHMGAEQIISGRVGVLMGREPGAGDALQSQTPKTQAERIAKAMGMEPWRIKRSVDKPFAP